MIVKTIIFSVSLLEITIAIHNVVIIYSRIIHYTVKLILLIDKTFTQSKMYSYLLGKKKRNVGEKL